MNPLTQSTLPGRGQSTPPLMLDSIAGRDSFEFYCASCHGTRGKGDGPIASALKVAPSDLTSLARRNRGAFPEIWFWPWSRVAADRCPDMAPLTCPHGVSSSAGSIRQTSRKCRIENIRHLRWDPAGAGRWSGRFGCTAVQNALCDVPRTERARRRTTRRPTSPAATGPDEVQREEWRRVSERTASPDHRRPRRAISRRPRHACLG